MRTRGAPACATGVGRRAAGFGSTERALRALSRYLPGARRSKPHEMGAPDAPVPCNQTQTRRECGPRESANSQPAGVRHVSTYPAFAARKTNGGTSVRRHGEDPRRACTLPLELAAAPRDLGQASPAFITHKWATCALSGPACSPSLERSVLHFGTYPAGAADKPTGAESLGEGPATCLPPLDDQSTRREPSLDTPGPSYRGAAAGPGSAGSLRLEWNLAGAQAGTWCGQSRDLARQYECKVRVSTLGGAVKRANENLAARDLPPLRAKHWRSRCARRLCVATRTGAPSWSHWPAKRRIKAHGAKSSRSSGLEFGRREH